LNMLVSPGQRVARFDLVRVLSRDARTTTWLAHDPLLDRDVALKVFAAQLPAPDRGSWLRAARTLSRLAHPNIVPLLEADDTADQACLVFAHVPGTTLELARNQRPPLQPREAVVLLLPVLEALAAAHALDIVHGGLTSRCVLLGDDGHVRVADFGHAFLDDPTGAVPLPAYDLAAAAGLLVEMLGGAALARRTGTARIDPEPAQWPPLLRADDGLRSILLRAIGWDAAARFDSARAMHTALSAWLNPGAVATESLPGHGTLDFLLRRMRHKTDFPALSDSVMRIQRMATSESESLGNLSEEILKDVALTHKLLRMVNTVHFSHAGGAGVGTVSRAVALIGFAGIRNMALSVLLLEHMNDRAHAAVLREQFIRSLMAATLAGELSGLAREGEDAFLAAMFQGLGRLLTEYYFPEEAQQIREQAAADGDMTAAAQRVLGLSLDDLGVGIAKAWGLPESLQRAMRTPVGEVRGRTVEAGPDRLRWTGRAAHALTDALLGAEGPEQMHALGLAAELYGPVLDKGRADILVATQAARVRLAQTARALGLHSPAGSASRRLLLALPGAGSPVPPALAPAGLAVARPANAMLQRGLDALRQTPAAPQVMLLRLLELLHRALALRCVVCCLREAATGQLVGRLAVGPGAREMSSAFRIEPSLLPGADLFSALCAKGADTLIADSAAGPVASRLPAWYRQSVNAPTFLMLPMSHHGQPLGLIYADMAQSGALVLGPADLSLLRALRDHAVAALSRHPGP
jgi:eukaryotic-like serine/threonine-protein kinase